MNGFFQGLLKIVSGNAKSGKRNTVYKSGFYLGAGIFGGIALNDLWRVFNLPGNNEPLVLPTGKPGESGPEEEKKANRDEYYQRLLAILVIAGTIVLDKTDLLPFGSGLLIGVDLANKTERGEYIGFA